MNSSAKHQFLQFSLVGVAGFIVDAGVLVVVLDLLGPYFGRLLSFTLAVIVTWLLNRSFTFAQNRSEQPVHKEFGQYFMAMIGGGSANYGVYAGLVFFFDLVKQWPILGVAIGSIVGLAINFSLAKNWIFKGRD